MFPKVFLAVLFCFIGLVLAADINEVKKTALKRLETNVASIKRLADETAIEVDKREGNVKIIGKHEREYGDGIIDTTLFQITKNANSAYMMANLLGSSNDVFRCIEYRHRDAKDDSNRYFSDRFLKPGHDYETKAEQVQRDQIKAWKDDYYKAISQYSAMYDRAVSEIQRSNTESYIYSVVKQFDKNTEEMGKIITVILPNLNKTHIQILRILENLVNNLQQFSKLRIEKTAQEIQACFPKYSLQSTVFDLFEL